MDNIIFNSTHELAQRIRERDVSAVEVLDAHVTQIAHHNPIVNAVITLDSDHARQLAQEADGALAHGELWGPLHGIPVALDDRFETAGMRTTDGDPALARYTPTTDATVVARLRRAGAIILGKTNMAMRAADIQTDNPLFGRTNNPWDLTCTPGGHVGGGAAAVAAGMSPFTVGADAGGSIRVPAHFCGVYALRPTEHRIPHTGHLLQLPGEPRAWRRLGVLGMLARSVEDLDLLLTILAGPDGHDWEVPPVPLGTARDYSTGGMRVAWADTFAGLPVTSDTRSALTGLAQALQQHGYRVEQRVPDKFDFAAAWDIFYKLMNAEFRSQRPEEPTNDHPHANMTSYAYRVTLAQRDELIRALERFFDEWDVFLCPVSSGPAFAHCPTGTPIAVDDQVLPYWEAGMHYCLPFSLTGHPTIVVPLAHSTNGLPIGVQLVGRRWAELELLAIAKRLVEIIGPFKRPPGY